MAQITMNIQTLDWKKCLDRTEAKGYDDYEAHSEIIDYIREVATVDEIREVLQNVELRLKKIVDYDLANSFFLRHLSEKEHDIIDLLMGVRFVALNEMMKHPTPAEVEGVLHLCLLCHACFAYASRLLFTRHSSHG